MSAKVTESSEITELIDCEVDLQSSVCCLGSLLASSTRRNYKLEFIKFEILNSFLKSVFGSMQLCEQSFGVQFTFFVIGYLHICTFLSLGEHLSCCWDDVFSTAPICSKSVKNWYLINLHRYLIFLWNPSMITYHYWPSGYHSLFFKRTGWTVKG